MPREVARIAIDLNPQVRAGGPLALTLTWLDASGPEDAARYRKRTEAGTWKGFVAPTDLGASTSGRLLHNKRTRDLPGDLKHQPHSPTRRRRLDDAERKARAALNHLRDLRE